MSDAPGYQTAPERRAEQRIRPARPQPSVKAGRPVESASAAGLLSKSNCETPGQPWMR